MGRTGEGGGLMVDARCECREERGADRPAVGVSLRGEGGGVAC